MDESGWVGMLGGGRGWRRGWVGWDRGGVK